VGKDQQGREEREERRKKSNQDQARNWVRKSGSEEVSSSLGVSGSTRAQLEESDDGELTGKSMSKFSSFSSGLDGGKKTVEGSGEQGEGRRRSRSEEAGESSMSTCSSLERSPFLVRVWKGR